MGYGACVGHGAVPELPREDDITGPNEWELLKRQKQRDINNTYWRRCGFAVLDFAAGKGPEVTYIDQYGEISRSAHQLKRLWRE